MMCRQSRQSPTLLSIVVLSEPRRNPSRHRSSARWCTECTWNGEDGSGSQAGRVYPPERQFGDILIETRDVRKDVISQGHVRYVTSTVVDDTLTLSVTRYYDGKPKKSSFLSL